MMWVLWYNNRIIIFLKPDKLLDKYMYSWKSQSPLRTRRRKSRPRLPALAGLVVYHVTTEDCWQRRPSQSSMAGPPTKSLVALQALRSKVFGTTHNPSGVRTGGKYLRKPLVGAAMLRYYPPQLNLKTLRDAVPAIGRLTFPEEMQRLADVDRKKMLGKGPPKKGMLLW